MAYETAIRWAIDHIPPQEYDSYNEWYRAVSDKMNTPSLMSNPSFNRMLESVWEDITGMDTEKTIVRRTSSTEREVNIPQSPRIFVAPSKELEKRQEVIALPQTGRAPEIPRPILIFPKEQMSEIDKIKKFFGRLNPFRRQ